MGNILKNILRSFEKNDKKLKIKSSGSTKYNSNEKIRSGQAYLYKKFGMESEVIEVRFDKNVWGGYLVTALSTALKRYPYLNTKLIEIDGDFYIVQNDISIVPRKTKNLANLGSISCGYHLVDVTYYEKSLFISFHHALCDGKGIKPFVETLIYYYCQQRYKSSASSNNIRLAEDLLLKDEIIDPNLKEYDYDDTKEYVETTQDGYALPENKIIDDINDYKYEILIENNSFMKVCKDYHATPVILISLLVSQGIAKIYPSFEKPIIANIAVDIRDSLDLPNTYKNCVRSMPLPFNKEFLNLPFEKQVQIQREILTKQRDKDNCRRLANNSLKMFDKLDSLQSFEEKQKVMSFFEGMLINTYVISYLGQMTLNENEQYVKGMFIYNSGAVGLGVTMISLSKNFCLTFKQNFKADKYLNEFLKLLDEFKIKYSASDVIPFTTPTDKVIKRK